MLLWWRRGRMDGKNMYGWWRYRMELCMDSDTLGTDSDRRFWRVRPIHNKILPTYGEINANQCHSTISTDDAEAYIGVQWCGGGSRPGPSSATLRSPK